VVRAAVQAGEEALDDDLGAQVQALDPHQGDGIDERCSRFVHVTGNHGIEETLT
jgi:hypothetical protein